MLASLPMRCGAFSIFLFLVFSSAIEARRAFSTTWRTDRPGISNTTPITVPVGEGTDYEVDWDDDGVFDETGLTGSSPHLRFGAGTDADKLLGVKRWGDIEWASMAGTFEDCSNLRVTSPSRTFADATAFNRPTGDWAKFMSCPIDRDLGDWPVVNMSQLFAFAGMGFPHYDSLLIQWTTLDLQENVPLEAGNSKYCAGADARAYLIDDLGWKVSDGALRDDPPIAICQDITVILDRDGRATITPEMLDGGSTDDFSGANLTFTASKTEFSCSDIGSSAVNLTVTDASGQTDVCTGTVTVEDAPLALYGCPTNIEVAAAESGCTAAVTWIPPTANCTATVSSTHAPGDLFPTGVTRVTYTAQGADGLPETCSFLVTVNSDLEIADVTTTDVSCAGSGDGTAAVRMEGGVSPYSFDWSKDGGGDFDDSAVRDDLPGGVHTLTVRDHIGCAVSDSVDIGTAPMVLTDCPADIRAVTDVAGCVARVTWDAPRVSCAAAEVAATHRSGDAFPVGETPVVYTFTDGRGDTLTCRFLVRVESTLNLVVEKSEAPSCHGSGDGSLRLAARGGYAPYRMRSDSEPLPIRGGRYVADSLSGGSYAWRVTDAVGCSVDTVITLEEPGPLALSSRVVPHRDGGLIDLDIVGGTTPYHTAWKGRGWKTGSSPEDAYVLANGPFVAQVTDVNGCAASLNTYVDFLPSRCPSIEFSVYPNPSPGTFKLEFRDCAYSVPISVYDALGRLVGRTYSFDLDQDFNFQNLRRGVYYLRVDQDGESVTQRILIE